MHHCWFGSVLSNEVFESFHVKSDFESIIVVIVEELKVEFRV